MTHDEKIVEAVARAIKGQIKVDASGLAPAIVAHHITGFEEAARAAITAYQAEVEKDRLARTANKAQREGFENKLDWIRQYRMLTGYPLRLALAAYDADQPLPPAPKATP